ncbi:MAG: hypothetical protein KDK54_13245 [Leptospiraceae bacterium]|nr:hypothetical protein [Leptospiraceae bacterium]
MPFDYAQGPKLTRVIGNTKIFFNKKDCLHAMERLSELTPFESLRMTLPPWNGRVFRPEKRIPTKESPNQKPVFPS